MARPNWLNENSNRAFPFIKGTVNSTTSTSLRQLPNDVVVDCGILLGEACGFDTSTHGVFLARVRRLEDVFYFDMATSAPLMAGSYLTFTRNLDAERYLTEHVDSAAQHNFSQSSEACDAPLWEGYLITGALASLAALLPGDGELVRAADDATLEPALTQNLSGAYVKSLALANSDRTRATAPPGCEDIVWPFPVSDIYVGPTCLQGNILLAPGHNCVVRQSALDNSLVLVASVGAGAGEPCAEVPLLGAEVPPAGSSVLEGGLLCNEALRSLNGLGGPMLSVSAGAGVIVEEAPDTNTLTINVNMSGLALCAADVSSISSVDG